MIAPLVQLSLQLLVCLRHSCHAYVVLKTTSMLLIDDDEVPHVSEMDTRMVLRRGSKCVEEFLDYWGENLPDLSERPDIAPESTRFWMMAVSDIIFIFISNPNYV